MALFAAYLLFIDFQHGICLNNGQIAAKNPLQRAILLHLRDQLFPFLRLGVTEVLLGQCKTRWQWFFIR